MDACEATVIWDVQSRNVSAYATGTTSLIGMSLIYGYKVWMVAV